MTTLTLSPEQEQLRTTVRRLFDRRSPEPEVRRLMATESGLDASLWEVMSGELGLAGLAVPEEYGGAGYGLVELGVVLEEAGRALVVAPLLSSAVLATQAVLLSEDAEACKRLLPPLVSGETRGTLAFTEESGSWDLEDIAVSARPVGSAWSLDGTKSFVLDGHTAGVLVVSARTPGGTGLFLVDANSPGVARTPLPTMDQTRKQARIVLAGATGRLLGEESTAPAALRQTLLAGATALAAEQVGGAQRVLEMAVEYAKTRVQFGRPIGSFQAIKHKCADMLVETESARSAAYYALAQLAAGAPDRAEAAHVAKAYCSDAFLHAAGENIQVHGGIGFTWEHAAHLYFKRAKSSQLLFGHPAHHRDLLGRLLGV